MKLIESSVEIIPQDTGLEGVYKQIEIAGRVCYKSEDKICEGSAKKMVDFLVGRHHGSPLEHGTVYLTIPFKYAKAPHTAEHAYEYTVNKYSVVNVGTDSIYVTTNFRVLVENNWLDDLKYLCEPTDYHEKRITAKFICSRGVSHEAVRHRTMSFCQESQRYCNYSIDKHNNEVTFVIPEWVKDRTFYVADCTNPLTGTSNSYILDEPTLIDTIRIHMLALDRATCCWYENLKKCESDYLYLLTDECGLKPQEARGVLSNDCKTEVIITGFVSDWEHFFELRSSKAAHPDIRILSDSLKLLFIENQIIK